MKITRLQAFKVRIPTNVKYAEAGGTYTSFVRSLVVKIETDAGFTGIGDVHESVPGYTAETLDTMYATVTHSYGPALIGAQLAPEMVHKTMRETRRGNGFARCAVEMAVFDALARSRNISICAMLGGPVRRELQLVGGIGIDEVEVVVQRANAMVAAGYRTIKLKVGRPDIGKDMAMVKAVRAAVGDAIAIRVDANAGYAPTDAMVVARALGGLNIEHFEQPVAAENLPAMARLLQLGAVSIMADESVHTAEDAMRVVRANAADGIKVKMSKVGGFIEARRIVDVAESAGLKLIIGNGICSSIEAASELQLACAYPHVYPVAEMVGPAKLAGDLATLPFDLSGGKIVLAEGSGLGVDLCEQRLREYAIAG